MRKLICLLLAVLIAVLLSGCDYDDGYPKIRYINSSSTLDKDSREIQITDGYILNQAHSYDITDTEDGYSITLYFVKKAEVKDDE